MIAQRRNPEKAVELNSFCNIVGSPSKTNHPFNVIHSISFLSCLVVYWTCNFYDENVGKLLPVGEHNSHPLCLFDRSDNCTIYMWVMNKTFGVSNFISLWENGLQKSSNLKNAKNCVCLNRISDHYVESIDLHFFKTKFRTMWN